MRKLRRILSLALLLMISFGVAGITQQLLLAARPTHGLNSDSWRMTNAYWMAAGNTLTFSLEPGAQALRLLSNAISDRPLSTVDYNLLLDVRDQANRSLGQRTFAHRATDSRRQRRLSSVASAANRDAYTTEQSLFSLRDLPGAAMVRITLNSSMIEGIGLRSYWRQQRRENRLTAAWQRLHQNKRERLAAANVLPVGYLKATEADNLMRYRWRPLTPQGVATEDYQIATLFEPAQPTPQTPVAAAPSAIAANEHIGAYVMSTEPLRIPLHQSSRSTPVRLDLRLPLPAAADNQIAALTVQAWAGQRLVAEWQDQLSFTAGTNEWLEHNPQLTLSHRVQRYVDVPAEADTLAIQTTEGSLLTLYNRPAQAPFLDLREDQGSSGDHDIHNWQSLDRRLAQWFAASRQRIARRATQLPEKSRGANQTPMIHQSLYPERAPAAISVLLPLGDASERPAEQRYRRLRAGRQQVRIVADPSATATRLLITGNDATDTLRISSQQQTLLQLPAGSGVGRVPIGGLTPGLWQLLVEPGAARQLFLSHADDPQRADTPELFGERLLYPLHQPLEFLLPAACCAGASITVRLFGNEHTALNRTVMLSELLGGRRTDQISTEYTPLRKRSELTLIANPVVAMLNPEQPSLTHQEVVYLNLGDDLIAQPDRLRVTVESTTGPLYLSALLHRPETAGDPLKLRVAQR